MLVEKSWRNTNIDEHFCVLSLNKMPDFAVSTEEEDHATLRVELKFISEADVANMISDRFQI